MKGIVHARHFVEKGFVSHAKFMDDELYAQALDSIVFACVDIAVINDKGEILLGKRSREHMPDWWIIGGRMKPGESFQEAASRNIQRELTITVDQNRFNYLCTYSCAWAKRAQPPITNGSHAVSITMILQINADEIKPIRHNDEYTALKWVGLEKVARSEMYHPAIAMVALNILTFLEQQ